MNTSLINSFFTISLLGAVLSFLGLCLMSKSRKIDWSFFIFVRPFFKSRYIEVVVDESHIRSAVRGNSFKTPLALAMVDVIQAHGYEPLYVYGGQDNCKFVTEQATMVLQTSSRATKALDKFNKYQPVKPFSTTLKVLECRMNPQATLLERLISPFRNALPI
jgi:hypothetical protein